MGEIYQVIVEYQVMYLCGVLIVMQILFDVMDEQKVFFDYQVKMLMVVVLLLVVVLVQMVQMGIDVMYVYGLIEMYGLVVVCVWQEFWDDFLLEEQVEFKLCQGVIFVLFDGLMVVDVEMFELVFDDGEILGEVFMCGNIVMKGYLKNLVVIEEVFWGGWFYLGDFGVWYDDVYV